MSTTAGNLIACSSKGLIAKQLEEVYSPLQAIGTGLASAERTRIAIGGRGHLVTAVAEVVATTLPRYTYQQKVKKGKLGLSLQIRTGLEISRHCRCIDSRAGNYAELNRAGVT